MNYVLDTDVLSESQKTRPNPVVLDWLSEVPAADLHISVLSIGELGRGVTKLRERGDIAQAVRRQRWLSEAHGIFEGRILSVTLEVAQAWGWQSMRRSPPSVDGLIAATALVHNLAVVTRNTRHFALTGVRMVNPFDG